MHRVYGHDAGMPQPGQHLGFLGALRGQLQGHLPAAQRQFRSQEYPAEGPSAQFILQKESQESLAGLRPRDRRNGQARRITVQKTLDANQQIERRLQSREPPRELFRIQRLAPLQAMAVFLMSQIQSYRTVAIQLRVLRQPGGQIDRLAASPAVENLVRQATGPERFVFMAALAGRKQSGAVPAVDHGPVSPNSRFRKRRTVLSSNSSRSPMSRQVCPWRRSWMICR